MSKKQLFNLETYYSTLKTRRLGRPCVFLDRVDSTIEEASTKPPNTIVVASQQTKGRGRGDNVWVSPLGCAMATVKIACEKTSYLASRLCFLQHLITLISARTLKQIDETKFNDDRIKLKWPNDLMYSDGSSEWTKIGGVLVHTTDNDDIYDVRLSFGINVANDEPTTCLNKILGPSKAIGVDCFIANMMNGLEEITCDLTEEKFQQLKQEYKERCLHMNKTVNDVANGQVHVDDVTDDGFLLGRAIDSNEIRTVIKIV